MLGFHGLDEEIGKKVLNGRLTLRHSQNSYDWLGHGIYFWESSPERAYQFAEQSSQRQQSTVMNIKFDSVRAAFWEGEELYPNAGV